MIVDIHDLIWGIAVQAVAVADATLSGLSALFAAGTSNGVDPGPLALGTGTALAAGGAAAAGGATGGGGSSTGGGAGSTWPAPPPPRRTSEDVMRDIENQIPEARRQVEEDQREHDEEWERQHGTDPAMRG
jgi:hypothetical protein